MRNSLRLLWWLIPSLGALLPGSGQGAPKNTDGLKALTGIKACTSDEKWNFGPTPPLRADFVQSFQSFLNGKRQPVQGFSDALALRRLAQNEESKYFAEYWVSRSLYDAKLLHIAQSGFAHIAARPPTVDTVGIQLSALDCLIQIHLQKPSLGMPSSVTAQLASYQPLVKGAQANRVLWEAASEFLQTQLGETKQAPSTVEATLALLKGSGPYEAFGRGLWAAHRGDHATTIRRLEEFLGSTVIPPSLKKFVDTAHITMARALYTKGEYEQAMNHFKQVTRSSNELASSLSELSWAYLLDEKYSEAIGTAMNLQTGGLRYTFEPEAQMVMAMSLNELCQYPESVRAVNIFKKFYEEPYKWMVRWESEPGAHSNLYPKAIDYIKKGTKTPRRIASEWVRSPLFISTQDEINLIFDEDASTAKLGRSGSKEQAHLAQEIIQQAVVLKPQVKIARAKLKEGEHLPKQLLEEIGNLKRTVLEFRRMQQAAPVWRAVLSTYQKQVSPNQKKLMARIESDLRDRTSRMRQQIEEIAENIQLIEVEMYNGASQDIIWQNAHPDYKELAKKMTKDHEKAQAAKVWDWGKVTASNEENSEIWEDELGSFKANLYDNCSSKDRYLAIKMQKGKTSRE